MYRRIVIYRCIKTRSVFEIHEVQVIHDRKLSLLYKVHDVLLINKVTTRTCRNITTITTTSIITTNITTTIITTITTTITTTTTTINYL